LLRYHSWLRALTLFRSAALLPQQTTQEPPTRLRAQKENAAIRSGALRTMTRSRRFLHTRDIFARGAFFFPLPSRARCPRTPMMQKVCFSFAPSDAQNVVLFFMPMAPNREHICKETPPTVELIHQTPPEFDLPPGVT